MVAAEKLKQTGASIGYDKIVEKDYLIIKPHANSANIVSESFVKDVYGQLQGGKHLFVILDRLESLDMNWCKFLSKAATDLRVSNKSVALIKVSPSAMQQLNHAGVLAQCTMASDLRDAQLKLKLINKKSFTRDLIEPFLQATVHVLGVQAQTVCKAGAPALKTDSNKLQGDISGIIGIVSESFQGYVVISFPEQTFLKIMSKMLGENYTQLSPELTDGAGELSNMILGQAKVALNEKGYSINTALPSVVSGKGHSVSSKATGATLFVPFESAEGPFYVEIGLTD